LTIDSERTPGVANVAESRPVSLLLATLNYPPAVGGIENLARAYARELVALGVELRVVAPRVPGWREFDRGEPYPIVRVAGGELRHLGLAGGVIGEVARGAEQVLFMQWTGAALPLFALGRRVRRCAIVCHGKEMIANRRGTRSRPWWVRTRHAVLRRADRVITVSRFTGECARRIGVAPEQVVVLNPGVDLERFHPVGRAIDPPEYGGHPGPRLLTVTRLVERKGVDTVIESLPSLPPQVRYFVAGDGLDRDRLRALARERGVADRVVWLGRVADDRLPALYRAADIVLLVSRQDLDAGDVEGFGMVLLEAQACGTPVVGGDAGGIPDALVDGETGLLVPPRDPPAVAAAVRSLLEDPERMARMREAALAHARACGWGRVGERLARTLGLSA
jgi:phosphatidylinositol alpha-1,6-mannosyltransferase